MTSDHATSDRSLAKLHPLIREQATEWFVAFCEAEVDAAGRRAFDQWLRASPQHVRAYLRISAFYESADLIGKSPDTNIDALVEKALAEHNTVALYAERQETPAERSRAPARWRHMAVAAGLLILCALLVSLARWPKTAAILTYQTGAGEQRIVQLADGSTVRLDARSRMEVQFTPAQRMVILAQGQALFRVAANPTRPFRVQTDRAQITAIGTEFDVYRKSAGTAVTVVEGTVAVWAGDPGSASGSSVTGRSSSSASPVFISAGEQTVVTGQAPARASRANVDVVTAWTRGELIFHAVSLQDVVEEFNQTSSLRLVVDDEALLNYHISGDFPYADPTSLEAFLQQRFGVVAVQVGAEIHIRQRH